ncbi:hypothetical protein PS15m_009877 [Mucor circinelloides]
MSDPVNTATDTSEAPALQVPPKDSATETAPANHTASTAATATGVNATGPKVTPVQRLSSVYKKAKQTVTDAVAEANKAINEKKAAKPAATATEGATTDTDAVTAVTTTADPVATSQVPTATQGKKVGTSNIAFKDLLARVKGLARPTSTHPAPAEASTSDETAPPVPPPKDNIKSNTTTNTNPVMDQLKRNTTLLANYLVQKKKEFQQKSSHETQQNEHATSTAAAATAEAEAVATPEVHHDKDTTQGNNTAATSPLVRRITRLVHTATTTINKKKDQFTKKETHPTTAPATTAPATTAAAESDAVATDPVTTTVA